LSNRSRNKILVVLHGVFERAARVWGLPLNPAAQVERHPRRAATSTSSRPKRSTRSPARPTTEDVAIFIVAAFTGLRERSGGATSTSRRTLSACDPARRELVPG
jgi:hypothetical protein